MHKSLFKNAYPRVTKNVYGTLFIFFMYDCLCDCAAHKTLWNYFHYLFYSINSCMTTRNL